MPGWLRSAGPLSGPFPTNFDVHRLDPDVRFTSIRAIRSLTTNVRSDQAEERAGLVPVGRDDDSRSVRWR